MFRKDYLRVILLCLFTLNILRPVLGQGSGSTISPFEDCTGHPTLANSNTFTGETTHGTVLTVICNSGYTNTGAEQYICYNGEWDPNGSGGEPYCAIQCAVPSFENGQTYLTNYGCSYENCTIVFTCDTGYTIIGQHILTCQSSGSWGDLPTCQIVDCGAPIISNGEHTGSITYGSEVTFECTGSSYFLIGSVSAVCGASGNWSELPSCVYTCGSFPDISNADMNFSCSYEQLEGCSVLVTCATGYTLVGDSTLQCIADEGWETQPFCANSSSNSTSYTVTVVVRAPAPENREAFEAEMREELLSYYIEQMGEANVVAVVIISITYESVSYARRRKRQTNTSGGVAVVDYIVAIADTPEAQGEFSSAQAGLVTTKSLQLAGKTVFPLETTYSGLTLQRTNGSAEAVKEASCKVFALTHGACPSGSECQVFEDGNNAEYTACQPVPQADDDFALKVGLGVGIPLFLLTCALIGVIAYYIYASRTKRRRRWRRKQLDFDDTDSAARSGFSPFAVPARLNPNGRRGPFYGSNISDGWDDAASVDSDGDPRDKYEKPYFVPVGYQSGQSKLASNYSWDFMYPHLDDRFSMPRPRI